LVKLSLKRAPLWNRVAHCDPPAGLEACDPALYRPIAYEAVLSFLEKEGYQRTKNSGAVQLTAVMAYAAAALFSTEQRVLEYLNRWGKSGKQPLHDIIYQISIPLELPPETNLSAWADAVIQHGPDMAKLVKFCDKLPEPAKSADGKTWSLQATRAAISQFVYARGNEHPELATLCFNEAVGEHSFNRALDIVKTQTPHTKNLPAITLNSKDFDMEGATFHLLPANDIRGLFLGELTDCCQSIGGAGENCAKHGFTSRDSGFYVIETDKGEIIGQTWAWRGTNGELVFDSLETLGERVSDGQWVSLTQAFAAAVEKSPGDVTAFSVGMGGKTPKLLCSIFAEASAPAAPIGYDRYRDSNNQVQVWKL